MDYFTADTHFYHEKLLASQHFSPRPYDNLKDEHAGLIHAWRQRITDQDTVYHLGDIAMMNHVRPERHAHELVLEIVQQLPGHIVFIKGNHDTRSLFKYLQNHNFNMKDGRLKFEFEDVGRIVKANHHQFFLTHYPLILGQSQNSINLHGHIHHNMVPIPENINVGVDSADLDYLQATEKPVWGSPLLLQEIEIIMQRKHDDFAKRR